MRAAGTGARRPLVAAGHRGIEPRVAVLETAVLPLHQCPWRREISRLQRRPTDPTRYEHAFDRVEDGGTAIVEHGAHRPRGQRSHGSLESDGRALATSRTRRASAR